MSLWQKLWSLFNIKAHMQLNKLRTAEVRGAEIAKKIEIQREDLRQSRITVREDHILYKNEVEKVEQAIEAGNNLLLQAADSLDASEADLVKAREAADEKAVEKAQAEVERHTFNIQRLDSEVRNQEALLVEKKRTLETLAANIAMIDEQDRLFVIQADKARQVVETSKARYKAAKTLLRTNHGRLSPDIVKQIKELEESANALSAKAEATRQVQDIDNKSDIENIKDSYAAAASGTATDRIARLRAARKA